MQAGAGPELCKGSMKFGAWPLGGSREVFAEERENGAERKKGLCCPGQREC